MDTGKEKAAGKVSRDKSAAAKVKKETGNIKDSAQTSAKESSKKKAGPELSEELRKLAAKYDESDYRHWIPIAIADRVGKIEAVLEDLAPDNTILDSIVEFGRNTDWTADKKTILKKAATTIGAASFDAVSTAVSRKIKENDK